MFKIGNQKFYHRYCHSLYKGVIKYSRTPSGCPFNDKTQDLVVYQHFKVTEMVLPLKQNKHEVVHRLSRNTSLEIGLPLIDNIQPSFILSFKNQTQRPLHALKLVTPNLTDQEMFDTLIISIQSLH